MVIDEWLQAQGLPKELAQEVSACLPKRQVMRGCSDFECAEDVLELNGQEAGFPREKLEGFLIVGTCFNGDLVAVDYREKVGHMYYLPHSSLWDEEKDMRSCALEVAESPTDFESRRFTKGFPEDCYGGVCELDLG